MIVLLRPHYFLVFIMDEFVDFVKKLEGKAESNYCDQNEIWPYVLAASIFPVNEFLNMLVVSHQVDLAPSEAGAYNRFRDE